MQPHEVPVIGVSFSGNLKMPIADQNQIMAELKRLTYSEPLTGAGDDLTERVRRAWQDRGFFQVEANGDAIFTNRGVDRGLAFSVHLNEGPQYRLRGISFRGNKAIRDVERLRSVFLIKDGEVFGRSLVVEGLQNLRKAYGEFGYINYVGVPNTSIDDETRRISVVVDVDEGKQFYVERVEMLGLDDTSKEQLLRQSPLGGRDVYNARLDELFLGRIKSQFPGCGCSDVKHNQIDEQKGTVVLTYDLRGCVAGK